MEYIIYTESPHKNRACVTDGADATIYVQYAWNKSQTYTFATVSICDRVVFFIQRFRILLLGQYEIIAKPTNC